MDADVIVIGGGGGGAVVAKELGEKGIKVLLLEAGPWYGNKKWPNPNTERGEISSSSMDDLSIDLLKKSFTDLEDDMNNPMYGKFRWGPANSDLGPWPRNISSSGYAWQNAGIGGTTLHYWANSPRAYPQAVDNIWPISYEELLPYYEKVEATLPVQEAPATPKEDLFFYGAKQAGWQPLESPNVTRPGYRPQRNAIIRPYFLTNPQQRNMQGNTQGNIQGNTQGNTQSNTQGSTQENTQGNTQGSSQPNRRPVGCTLRGQCTNGCHIGPSVPEVAKRSTLVSYIPLALSTGNVEIRPNAFVVKILTEYSEQGTLYTTGVIYRDTWTGETTELHAKVVVVSAGGIETPRLWLNSKLPENEWVGKGLVNHWFDSVSAIFDEKTIMDVLGVPAIKPFVGQNGAARFDYPGLGVVEPYGMSPGIYSSMAYETSQKGFYNYSEADPNVPWDIEGKVVGEKLKEFMIDYTRTLSVLIFTDDDVNQNNSVTLDPVLRDENGYIPVLNYHPSELDRKRRDQLAYIASDIFRKAGAKTIIRANWPPDIFIHITSTMRIGYVTDTNCEAYQVKGLFIADNSVLFNGLGGPNPTLTNQAMATRTAEKIVQIYF